MVVSERAKDTTPLRPAFEYGRNQHEAAHGSGDARLVGRVGRGPRNWVGTHWRTFSGALLSERTEPPFPCFFGGESVRDGEPLYTGVLSTNVRIVRDATATFDRDLEGEQFDVDLVHQTALAHLAGEFATVVSAADLPELIETQYS